jgi:hypothetical protein
MFLLPQIGAGGSAGHADAWAGSAAARKTQSRQGLGDM